MKELSNPRLVIFQCQFNMYSDADQQQIESQTPAGVKFIRVPCAGRISPFFLLNAVQGGADGVMISGCAADKCHFKTGNLGARRQLDAFKGLLVYLGLEPERIRFVWLAPFDRGRLVREFADFHDAVCRLGPAERLAARGKAAQPGEGMLWPAI
jgi:coenzyme F420-reducing hydrogenase delta subunit